MNRLLQGDVGSGKTVVAIAVMLLAIESGTQAALMAPTQILAEQHYDVLCRWLEPLGVAISLRTGREEGRSVAVVRERALAVRGRIPGRTGWQPVVPESLSGTPEHRKSVTQSVTVVAQTARRDGLSARPTPEHPKSRGWRDFCRHPCIALRAGGLENPGLVVIDEQHKFGVRQRGHLTTVSRRRTCWS
jgi:superfamily II DNA or RNA helicase